MASCPDPNPPFPSKLRFVNKALNQSFEEIVLMTELGVPIGPVLPRGHKSTDPSRPVMTTLAGERAKR